MAVEGLFGGGLHGLLPSLFLSSQFDWSLCYLYIAPKACSIKSLHIKSQFVVLLVFD